MHALFMLVLLLAPITRFPGFFDLVAPVKAVLAVVALGAWVVVRARRPRMPNAGGWSLAARPMAAVQIGFLAWISLTLLFSTNPSAPGGRVLLAHATVFAFFFPFLALASETPRRHRHVLWTLLATATAIACLAILQYAVVQFGVLRGWAALIIPKVDRDLFLVESAAIPAWGYRSWGTFHHPNLLGAYLALVLPILVALLWGARSRRARGLLLVATVLIAVGLFCSGSRGGWLNAAVGGGVLWLLCAPRLSRRFVLGLLAGLATLAVLFSGQLATYLRLDNVLSNRDIIWKNTWTLISERPWVGWGPGTYSRTYLDRFDFPTDVERFTATREMISLGRINLLDHWHAHNLFLHQAAEMGLPVLVLLLLLFSIYTKTIVQGRALWFASVRDQRALLVAGCSAAVAGNVVHSLLETTINVADPSFGIPFIFVVATGLASMREAHGTVE